MRIVIDLDLRQAVAGFATQAPAQTITQKSQDTGSLSVYFVQSGAVQDLGSGTTLKFGLIAATGGALLVLCTSFTRQVDANSNVYYLGYPIFNTSNLLTALGSNTSISCLAEVRYQQPSGEIDHSIDIPYTIWRTILTEITSDVTTANFTTPAIGSNVTVAIGSTTWLLVGQQLTISGAGVYQVISITDATHFVAQNTGAAGNASSGTVINSGAAVAGAPVNNLTTYPASSNLELISTRDVASGHAGLDSSTLLKASEVPVDAVTLVVNASNKVAVATVTSTTANFTTPAASSTVSVTVVSTTGMATGQFFRIPGAGYYSISSVTDGTHVVLTNTGDPSNASSGTVINSGAVLITAQSASAGGAAGQNAYTTLTSGFTVPAVNATINIVVGATGWMGGAGYVLFITGAGYYSVQTITNSTNVVVLNLGTSANASPGTVIGSSATVNPAGAVGSSGATGAALSAYDALTSSFTMPAAAANVTAAISNTAWLAVAQTIFVATAGYFSVVTINSSTSVTIQNLNYPGNASVSTVIASGSKMSPGGLQGATGSGGAGKNSFTNLATNFTQPSVGSTVSINVGAGAGTAWMALGQVIFIQGGGYYTVSSITDATDAVVTNLGYVGNAAVSSTVTSGASISVTPGGIKGLDGVSAFTTTSANFTQPTAGSTVTVTVVSTSWMAQGQNVFIPTAGYYSVSSVTDSTHMVLTNSNVAGNATAGTVISSGSMVSPAGATGSGGTGGGGGGIAALSDAETSAGSSIINSTAGILKRLVGSAGVTLVDGGDRLILSIAPSGNSAGYWDPVNGTFWQDDFDTNASTLFTSQNSGGAIAYATSSYGQDSTKKVNGCIELSTGTGAGNVSAAILRSGNVGTYNIVYGLGALILKMRIFIEGTLPGTGIGYTARFGIAQAVGGTSFYPAGSGTALPQGFYFQYDPDDNSGKWRAVAGSTTPTFYNTTAAVAGDTAYDLEIDVNTAWTSITFYVNGALVQTVSSDIPTTKGTFFSSIIRGTGSSTSFLTAIDSAMLNYQFTR